MTLNKIMHNHEIKYNFNKKKVCGYITYIRILKAVLIHAGTTMNATVKIK